MTFTLPLKDFDIECKPITENNSRAIYRQVDPRMPGANGPAPGLLYEGQGTSDIKVVGYEVNFSWWPRIKSVVEQSGHLRVQETSDFERSLYGSLKEPISPQQFKNFTWPNVQTERKRIDEIENNALVATHRAAHP